MCQSLVVGSEALPVQRAVLYGAVFEFLGVVLMGGAVASSVSDGFIKLELYVTNEVFFSLGMFSVLMSAALWYVVQQR